jgi:hypothetical protein
MTPTPEQERAREGAGYTPGPWIYTRNPENTRWIIDGAPARAIACTAGYEPNNEANAHLIAAAPELLEALEGLVAIIEAAGLYQLSRGVELGAMSWGVKCSDRLDAARTAIRKARGETA